MNIPCKVLPFNTWMSERVYMGRPHHRIKQHLDHLKRARIRQGSNRTLLLKLQKQILQWECDVIYTNSSVIGIGSQLSVAMGLPHVWHIREFAQEHYGLHYDLGKRKYIRALKQTDRIITISKAVQLHLRSLCGRKDIRVIYNGVLRKDRFTDVRVRCPWPEGPVFTFAMMGLIHPSKGHIEAVEALADLGPEAKVRLLIAGTGRTKQLEERVSDLRLQQKVELLGYADDPYVVYAKCHVVLMCSKYEGMGRVTAEAMAAGRPVIGHASGGTVELIDSGMNGLLYGKGRADLGDCMKELISNLDNTKTMGLRAAEMAEVRFSIEEYGAKVMEVLKELEPEVK